MFEFAIKYLGFFKHVPLAPHLFDVALKFETFFSNRMVLDHIDEIEQTVLSWEQTSVQPHRFGGTQFNVGNREIGHIHGNGLLDIPFSRSTKDRLIVETNGKVREHHIFKESGWISLYIENPEDKILAIDVLKRSYNEKSGK